MSKIRHKEARPGNRNAADDPRLKVHLRLLPLNGKIWRILTLRPGTDAAFSTNYFHETWHIISNEPGARLLARLFWGVSYQRGPGTIFLLHGEHIRPTPFEAEPSQPFAICPANLSPPDPQAFRELKRLLPRLPNPTATIRLQTWGLDETLALEEWDERESRAGLGSNGDDAPLWQRERMTSEGGIICYTAPPVVLRVQGYSIARMEIRRGVGQTHHELADRHERRSGGIGDGEVQIFSRYRDMISEAAEARREVAQDRGAACTPPPKEISRQAVWDHVDAVSVRRQNALQARRQSRR